MLAGTADVRNAPLGGTDRLPPSVPDADADASNAVSSDGSRVVAE